MNGFYANVVLIGCGFESDFIEALIADIPLNICAVSSVDLSETFNIKRKESSHSELMFISGGVEPVLSFIRGWKKNTVLTLCCFFKDFDHNFNQQILNLCNFGVFDSQLIKMTNLNLFDLSWLRGRVFRQVVKRTVGFCSKGAIFNCAFDFGLTDSLLNLGWFIVEFFLPVSVESFHQAYCVIKGRNCELTIYNSPNESISYIIDHGNVSKNVTIVRKNGIIESSLIGETADKNVPFADQLLTAIKNPSLFKGYYDARNLVNYLFKANERLSKN
ncbi:MAG: hypothetical protein NZO16_07775 [Deltaproteobacteria bacterium]|nr:hypothetical protein [Deltaproteobacteria bacterium]